MENFFVPCLGEATTYDRIAGYFSASVFASASHGFSAFVNRPNAKYRLIVGAKLVEDERDIIFSEDFELLLQDHFLKSIIETGRGPISQFQRHRLQNLSYMLKHEILEMKVAVRMDADGRIMSHREAEFHEKGGVFTDSKGNKVFFEGSVNESNRGWQKNQEKISVFTSWWSDDNRDRIATQESDFDEYWGTEGKNHDLGVVIYGLPSSSAEKIIEMFPPMKPRPESDVDADDPSNEEPTVDDRWIHQKQAVNWFISEKINGVGIFEMATGSGKTRTSIGCMRSMLALDRVSHVIVTVPNSLLKQWKEELRTHIPRHDLKRLYEYSSAKRQHLDFKRSPKGSFMVVTHSMLPRLLESLSTWRQDFLNSTMLVVDELHNVGADRFRNESTDEIIDLDNRESDFLRFGYRLGLSATPWSDHDEEHVRNSFLVSSFTRFPSSIEDLFSDEEWQVSLRENDYVFYFGLEDGIRKGILAEFDYMPIEYQPSEEEIEQFNEHVRKSFAKDEHGKTNPLGAIRAAAVFKGSRDKITKFKLWLSQRDFNMTRCLMFVEDTAFGEELMESLNKTGYTNFSKFFQSDADENLRQFAIGNLDFLVSCHRISEGIDIQTVSQVVLFSSASARLETIQRIGRALRKGSGPKRALVIDFVYDNPNSTSNPDMKRKKWLETLAKERNPT
jgi:superfamily II DNA or RNA helicase